MDLPRNTGKVKNIEKLDNVFFNISDQDAHLMDPQMRILHEVTYESLLDAGINPADTRGSKFGHFIGMCYDDSEVAFKEDEAKAPAYQPLAASRISYNFGWKGPCSTMDTACASSFSAFVSALTAIRQGECHGAVVSGLAVHLRPSTAAAFHNLQMLSDDGRSKCMDASGKTRVVYARRHAHSCMHSYLRASLPTLYLRS